jgi:hypothetical protein
MAGPKSANELIPRYGFKCHFCSAKLSDKALPEARNWDWVTGRLPATEHCCPKCQVAHAGMWGTIIARAASGGLETDKENN